MQYDGNRLRGKKTVSGVSTYYLRSSALGGQVVADITSTGLWAKGYVYLGSQLLAIQLNGAYYVHSDPVAKGKRITDSTDNIVSSIELDPWRGETKNG